MKNKRERFIALFLIISLVTVTGNLTAAERKGVRLIIHKTDGQQIDGELISIKRDSILILDTTTEVDTTVNINVIDFIHVKNKDLMWELGMGAFLLLGATRMMLHSQTKDKDTEPGQHQDGGQHQPV